MEKETKDTKPKMSNYARFSTLVIQMGAVIAFFTWLGMFLDKKYALKTPVWTIILSLFGVFMGLYIVIKDVIKASKDDEK